MNDTKFNISELTLEEVNIILAGLQELPAKVSNPVTQKVRTQAEAQLAAAQAGAQLAAAQAGAPEA